MKRDNRKQVAALASIATGAFVLLVFYAGLWTGPLVIGALIIGSLLLGVALVLRSRGTRLPPGSVEPQSPTSSGPQ